jgi:hypothetical protein
VHYYNISLVRLQSSEIKKTRKLYVETIITTKLASVTKTGGIKSGVRVAAAGVFWGFLWGI